MKNSVSASKLSIAGRVTVVVVTVLLFLLIAAYGIMWILVNGPSPTARRLFVLSVKETSAGGFLANLYLSDAEIDEILSGGEKEVLNESVDESLIALPDNNKLDTSDTEIDAADTDVPSSDSTDSEATADTSSNTAEYTTDTSAVVPDLYEGIEILDVTGSTFHGKLMIVTDPTRVFVGVPDSYGEGSYGLSVANMIKKYDCIAGTNAGGFYDPNGSGTGGIPEGIVIYEGELLWGSLYGSYSLAGIDANGLLHVGVMTGAQALDRGIQYAASYGPALVINGKAAGGTYGLGGGLNPRTAIGQRADGAMMLLVINGRSIDSLGATFDDLAEVMLSYGAVNATNLDGGSSSIMIMDGEYLTSSSYIFGERVVATAILVRK